MQPIMQPLPYQADDKGCIGIDHGTGGSDGHEPRDDAIEHWPNVTWTTQKQAQEEHGEATSCSREGSVDCHTGCHQHAAVEATSRAGIKP